MKIEKESIMPRPALSTEKCLEPPLAKHGDCPAFLALSLIANKWSVKILHTLLSETDHTLRFGQIQKSLATITQRELTKQLREFEKSGLVDRQVFAQIPPRVEYRLTPLGHSLWQPIQQLSDWAEENAATIQQKRLEFTQRTSNGV